MTTTILFSETQKAPKALRTFSVAITGFTAVFCTAVWFAIQQATPAMSTLETAAFFAATLGFPIVILAWLCMVRQTVTITNDTITVYQRGIHFKPKVIQREDVTMMSIRKLNAFGEFGGWGIRYGFNKTWGYIWGGNHAIELRMKDGKKFVISIVNADDPYLTPFDRKGMH